MSIAQPGQAGQFNPVPKQYISWPPFDSTIAFSTIRWVEGIKLAVALFHVLTATIMDMHEAAC